VTKEKIGLGEIAERHRELQALTRRALVRPESLTAEEHREVEELRVRVHSWWSESAWRAAR
jgi:hypothetical protein